MSQKLGIADPEQWLEDCPERIYDMWRNAYQLRPFGEEQTLLARIAGLLLMLLVNRGVKTEDAIKASDAATKVFMPSDWIGQADTQAKPVVDSQNIESFEQLAARLFS